MAKKDVFSKSRVLEKFEGQLPGLAKNHVNGFSPAHALELIGHWIASDALRRQTKCSKIEGKWGPNGIGVIGQMSISLQLVDVIYPCREGW